VLKTLLRAVPEARGRGNGPPFQTER
jgi:hypothetical protein